ncbi:hypothetical protein LLG07_00060 [bacterium]|nr:hypothetical protein [bacterium]
MGYYISNMIGIRTSGVFGGKTDMADMKNRIAKIVLNMRKSGEYPDLGNKNGNISHCMSKELKAHKGSYAVIGGVFNYWGFEEAKKFVIALSKEFQTEVMFMSWDEQTDEVQCNIYLAGKPLLEVSENPIGKILRRTS